jgi:type IV pilus assembly protein PilA
MFLQNLRAKIGARLNGDSEAGFTLIELLVVMLILGILAAIALPAFFNQKEKAGDAKAKEYAHTTQVAMETYSTEHGGSYVGATPAELKKIEPTIGSIEYANLNAGKFEPEPGPNTYEISVKGSTGQEFWIKNNAGTLTFPCKVAEKGGCPGPKVGEYGNWEKG